MIKEPKRLIEGSDELATAISAAQERLPSAERLAALSARLARAGVPLDGAPPLESVTLEGPGRPSLRLVERVTPLLPSTLIVVAASMLGAGLIALAVMIRQAEVPLVPPPTGPALAPHSAHQAPPATESAPTAAGNVATPPSASPAPASDSPAAPPTDARLVPSATNDEAVATSRAASTLGASSATTPPGQASLPGRSLAEARPPSSARSASPSGAELSGSPLAESTTVKSEIDWLKQARSALAVDPIQAFALTERCRAQYPSGSFAQEREYIAISALVRLGRTEEARSRTSLFRMHYGNSAYLPRLLRMLGDE